MSSRPVIALLGFAFVAMARADDDAWGARLELISEQAVIAPGRPFEIGIHIHHRDGFHSYWKNPGLVGFATQVDWKLPDGFTAGSLTWPPPELVDMAGHTCHGYHRDVLLTATITPPAELSAETVTLEARIAWMACSDACHPGDEVFPITLPVGPEPKADPDTAALFSKARGERPGPLTGWKVELLSGIDDPRIVLRLTRTDAGGPLLKDPYFFSSDGQVDDGRPSVASREAGVEIWTFERAGFGPTDAKGLPGIIAYGPEGARRHGTIAP